MTDHHPRSSVVTCLTIDYCMLIACMMPEANCTHAASATNGVYGKLAACSTDGAGCRPTICTTAGAFCTPNTGMSHDEGDSRSMQEAP